MFGKRINQEFCQFPSLERIANLSEAQIKKAKVGFRGKYMIDTSKKLLKKSQKGEEFFSRLEKLDSSHAHKELKNFYGVGDKIADCFLLFSFHRLERVPIDVWTKRILQDMYSLDPDKKYSTLQDKIYQIHGEYSGYAFSFLFEYIRNNGERS
jgi:N-glycosylase/DNA lyase